ncbi:histidine kinase [Flavobacteriaceae bacterium S356]|uniref:Histidine kinase n=1 Tax=Asprobacillus argus TaxID=3076534 RepID=A0ABU3LEV0_9FLAO|nr:histidine kinase [Flavobacteriaceae bacterium S356]
MKRLFIHHPLFRLLSPVFSGVIVYLLIILFSNDVGQLQEQFLGEDLYVCIGLSYVIQEVSRLLIVLFKKLPIYKSNITTIVLQVLFSIALTIGLVTMSISLYYKYIVGFSVTSDDLFMFNSVFSVISIIYILLYLSHLYLYKMNSDKLKLEEQIKQHIEEDFYEFKKGINPELLFESFEALLVLTQNSQDKADDFIDYLATIYRYLLSSREKQLVSVLEELKVLSEFEKLMNSLPYRSVHIQQKITSDFLVVPGSLLSIIEKIVKETIVSKDIHLLITLSEEETHVVLNYEYQDKIQTRFNIDQFEEIIHVYEIYSTLKIDLKETETERSLYIPKLLTKP